MDCKNELKTRHENNIYALKILNVDGNRVVVRNALDTSTCISLVAPDSYYEAGTYVDVAFSEKDKSFNARFIGITPPEFVPNDGAEIY